MTPADDDPFGRREEERTDAFGRPIQEGESASSAGSLWSGHVEERPAPPAPPAPEAAPTGGFLPPTDAPAAQSAWWAAPGGDAPGPAAATGEAAQYLERAGAAVIDFFIRAGIAIGVLIVVAAAGGGEDASAVALLVGYYVIAPFYAPLAMTRWDGQTVGHRAVSTRVVGRNGEPVAGGRAFVREIGAKHLVVEVIGGGLSLGIFTLVNYLWPLWDRRDEALHDKMCDTRVVKA